MERTRASERAYRYACRNEKREANLRSSSFPSECFS